jgi:acetyl-CoA carboxylase carboxyltransferase component
VSQSRSLEALTQELLAEEARIREGGGEKGRARQASLGRLTARERLTALLDEGSDFLELGLWAGWEMYGTWGPAPAAGVVTGVGRIQGRPCMAVANDATVKAGAFFPQTVKKVLRAQRIAFECGLPIVYLVDSAGVLLPLQDEVFPDEDDFGRIFRNNAVLSAAGIPQLAAIMGDCVAGGAYLPVLSDKLLMTEGSTMFLAGPALVKAAIGQQVDAETLGGAAMHAQVSGTIDFREADDRACLARLRELVGLLPAERFSGEQPAVSEAPARDPRDLYALVRPDGPGEYDVRDVLACIVDRRGIAEYKAEYGQMLVTAYASIGGRRVGVVANQHRTAASKREGVQLGGVIYGDSADKAARFVMDCNQTRLPLVFFQDVQGFMVGRDAEQSGIIRSGAKLVNAVSNSVVPKVTVILGGSFGAGNYALCGKAFDPVFIFAWPSARYAVMGASQAADTLLALEERRATRAGEPFSDKEREELRRRIERSYEDQTDIRYGAARGWVDGIIAPHATRGVLVEALTLAARGRPRGEHRFRTGVLQV